MNGIKLPANTLANWVIRSSDLYLSRIYDRLHEKILVTDGYQVYHTLAKEREDLIVAGCWIHTRRPYAEFIKALQRNENPTEGTIAEQAIRPFTPGRKNFVIIDTSKGAQVSTVSLRPPRPTT